MIRIDMPSKYLTLSVVDYTSIQPNVGGVYVLKDRYLNVLYVGKTSQFKRRISEHLKGIGYSAAFSNWVDKIDLYRIDEEYEREIYETFMIGHLVPKYNRAKVYVSSKEVKSEIEERLDELESLQFELTEEYEEIKTALYGDGTDEDDDVDEDFYYYTDEDEYESEKLGRILLGGIRLKRIEKELERLRSKISNLRKKL